MKKLLIIFSMCTLALSTAYSQDDSYYTGDEATVTVKSQEAPPALPQYVQPPCPEEGYIWTPGYWAWGTTGYYWVAGVWVMPPSVGVLWTPGYWGFYHGYYGWHNGYWGEHIGYYGGVNYGFGYYGSGFYGGRWEGGHFRYNTAVWHVGSNVHNTYVSREGVTTVRNHSSYNGPGGVKYRPATHEQTVMHENHTPVTKEQVGHEQHMGTEKGQFHSTNSRPATHSMSAPAPGGQRFDQRGHIAGGGGGQRSAPRGGGGGQHSAPGGGRGRK